MKKILSIVAIAFAFCLFNNTTCAAKVDIKTVTPDKSTTVKKPVKTIKKGIEKEGVEVFNPDAK